MTATIITASGASDPTVITGGNDGTLVIQTGPSGGKVNALTFGADGTPTFLKPVVGTLTAGTSCVYAAPIAASVKTTTAHGLGVIPTMIVAYAECVIAEQGYSIGDRILQNRGSEVNGFDVEYDATNVVIMTSNNTPLTVLNKTTPAARVGVTAANWKLVAIPYKLN